MLALMVVLVIFIDSSSRGGLLQNKEISLYASIIISMQILLCDLNSHSQRIPDPPLCTAILFCKSVFGFAI